MQLTRLTTRFVEDEDRFLISADSEKGVINLWLTQRLLKRLVPYLIDWVGQEETLAEGQADEAEPDSLKRSGGEATTESPRPAKEQAQSQLVAQYTNPQVASVSSDKAVQSCLVRTLKLEMRQEALRLVFVLPKDEEAVLILRETQARIWLGVLYKHWQQAQWPDIWPNWMKDAQQMRLAAPVSLMH